ncbi:MAG: sensor histidine kinase [Neptuniibacter sp.]
MKKTPLLLMILILLPVLLLSWYSIKLEKQQQLLLGHQLTGLIENQLLEVDQQLQGHFLRIEKALRSASEEQFALKDSEYIPDHLRELERNSPYVDQIFILNRNRKTIYPALPDSSVQERVFLEQYRPLLTQSHLFSIKTESAIRPGVADAAIEEELMQLGRSAEAVGIVSAQLKSAPAAPELEISSRRIAEPELGYEAMYDGETKSNQTDTKTEAELLQPEASGWIAWHLGADLQHIYWVEDPDGQVFGFKLNGQRLLSDLLNMLPDQSSTQIHKSLTNSAIRLVNNRGLTTYEWGELNEIDKQLKPIDMLPLSHPLGSWYLEFYSPSLQAPASNWLEKLMILALVLAGLLAIGWIVYREQTRATRLAEQRVNFVNQVSHELKTPLTNVRMYAEMLEHRLNETDMQEKRYLGVINSESLRLSRLIENVLSFSKLGRGSYSINQDSGNLSDVIGRVIENFAPAFNQKNIELQFDNQCDREAYFDLFAVEQILNNLLSNCEKYAADGAVVHLRCWCDLQLGFAFVSVLDNGPGIPQTESERIFESFYRSSNKLTDGVSGTGIGLSIARELARSHGGDLVLENSQSGACFLLKLPLSEVSL